MNRTHTYTWRNRAQVEKYRSYPLRMKAFSNVQCVKQAYICLSPDIYCRWRETDEKAAWGECNGAADRQKISVHLCRISVDQRTGN